MSLDLDAIKARATKHGNLVHGADALWIARASADDVPALLDALHHELTRREMMAYQRGAVLSAVRQMQLGNHTVADVAARVEEIFSAGMAAEIKRGYDEQLAAVEQDRDRLSAELTVVRRERAWLISNLDDAELEEFRLLAQTAERARQDAAECAMTSLTEDVVLCHVALIDVADTARRLYGGAEKASEVYGFPCPEHDYRLHLTTAEGSETTFHRGATADHVAADLKRRAAEPGTAEAEQPETFAEAVDYLFDEASEDGLRGETDGRRAALAFAGLTAYLNALGEELQRAGIGHTEVRDEEFHAKQADRADTDDALTRVVAEIERLDTTANQRIAERSSGDLSAWYARGVRGAVKNLRIVLGIVPPPGECPCDQFCAHDERCDLPDSYALGPDPGRPDDPAELADRILALGVGTGTCMAPDPNNASWFCQRTQVHTDTECDFVPIDQIRLGDEVEGEPDREAIKPMRAQGGIIHPAYPHGQQ